VDVFIHSFILAASTRDLYSLRVLAASDLFTLARVASSIKCGLKFLKHNFSINNVFYDVDHPSDFAVTDFAAAMQTTSHMP